MNSSVCTYISRFELINVQRLVYCIGIACISISNDMGSSASQDGQSPYETDESSELNYSRRDQKSVTAPNEVATTHDGRKVCRSQSNEHIFICITIPCMFVFRYNRTIFAVIEKEKGLNRYGDRVILYRLQQLLIIVNAVCQLSYVTEMLFPFNISSIIPAIRGY